MRPLLLALLASGSACQHGGSDSPLTNLGLAGRGLVGDDELQVMLLPEFGQGQVDQNGDGDVLDDVPYVFDHRTGTLTGLGLAAELGTLAAGGRLVAFAVDEDHQGALDRNGDGDALDRVVHVYDAGTGLTTNTGIATGFLARPTLGGRRVAFLASELEQGADLDGDGDASGFVLHVFDADTGLTTNTRRSATSLPVFHEHAFAFTTDEDSAGEDLNADGDENDGQVLQLYDLDLGLLSTPLGIRSSPLALGERWFVLVDEEQQGQDLNADGDELDGVWHSFEPGSGAVSLGFSSLDALGSVADRGVLMLVAEEIDGVDRNGDADLDDTFVFLHDPANARTFLATVPIDPFTPFAIGAGAAAFGVAEAQVGLDLNGDLDLEDDVLHALDTTNGNVFNTGVDFVAFLDTGITILVWRDESAVGTDMNGDGDQLDLVLAKGFPGSSSLEPIPLASVPPLLAQSTHLTLVAVSEGGQGQDLNGDGDQLDQVAYRVDVVFPIEGGVTEERLGVAVDSGTILVDGRSLLLVSEADQGRDLNGDGDRFDAVLHRFE